MKNLIDFTKIGSSIKKFAETYLLSPKEDVLTTESRFGQARLNDYDALFGGRGPEIKADTINPYAGNFVQDANSLPEV